MTRNRILRHETVLAKDLVPHELNYRTHGQEQRKALQALLDQVGFCRSVLAYEVIVNGQKRLKLIDGHLRTSMDPNAEITVEVLDVTDAEAKALLLSIDPLAQLADYDKNALQALRAHVHTDNDALANLWSSIDSAAAAAEESLAEARQKSKQKQHVVTNQYLVVITCQGEEDQKALLRRFKQEGLQAKALIS